MHIQMILITVEMAVGIFVPPAAPITNSTSPLPSVTIVGLIDELGRFCGAIIFPGDAGKSK